MYLIYFRMSLILNSTRAYKPDAKFSEESFVFPYWRYYFELLGFWISFAGKTIWIWELQNKQNLGFI